MGQLRNRYGVLSLVLIVAGVVALNLPSTESSAPVFFTTPQNLTVKNGQNAIFKCKASGFPVPKIRWYKKGVRLRNIMLRHYIGVLFKTLYIMPVYWSDAGQFTCEASNIYGTIRAHAYLRVVTKTKPTWLTKPHNTTLYEGQNFAIPCKANGFPDPIYMWTKGHSYADDDSSIIVTPAGDMSFVSASIYQTGDYTCAASNAAGSISKTIRVNVIQDPSIVKDPINATGVIGQELLLQCDVVGNPSTNVTWRKNGKPLNLRASTRISMTIRLKDRTINVHTLVITHAKDSDSAQYQCIASNQFATAISKIAVVNLTGYSRAPTVELPKQVISAAMYSDIKLKCIFTGTPLPQIKWLRDFGNTAIVLKQTSGEPLDNGKVETTLEIDKATNTDEGYYVCMGHNGAGVASGNITVKVQEDPRRPEVLPHQPKFTAIRGTNTTLKCMFTGNPQPEVTWYRKGLKLEDSLGELVPGLNNTYSAALMLAYVTFSDTGPYECQAQNPYGISQMIVELTVEGIPMPPTDFNFNRTSRTEVIVSWKPGMSDGSDVKFVIEYKHSEEDSWTEVEAGQSTSKLLRDVAGWDKVSIRVRARNSHGTSKPSNTLTIQEFENVMVNNQPKSPERSVGDNAVIGGAVAGAVVLAILVLLLGVVLWKKRKHKMRLSRQPRSTPSVVYAPRNHEEEILLDDQGQGMYSYVPVNREDGIQEPRQPVAEENEYETVGQPASWEVPKRSLTMSDDLGKGHFGKVVKAILKTKTGSKPVAVKMLKENAEPHHKKEFLAELELMKSIGPHPNIVGLVGCCTKGENPYIIVEYCCTGNLRDFLRKSKGNRQYSNLAGGSISLTSSDLLSFMWQVARGMSFLASKKLVHRDLAARNVLVHEGKVCKVADFGLARDIYQENQYLKTTQGELPLRWMALESIFHGITTIESDVWSFGVLMWEIITLGANPYPGFTREQLISNLHLGYRMPRPPYCNEELYGIIWQCWQKEPSERPTFPMLCRTLHRMMAAEKVLIDLVNFDAEYINAKKDGEPVSP